MSKASSLIVGTTRQPRIPPRLFVRSVQARIARAPAGPSSSPEVPARSCDMKMRIWLPGSGQAAADGAAFTAAASRFPWATLVATSAAATVAARSSSRRCRLLIPIPSLVRVTAEPERLSGGRA
jgi:hypothetical protein